jgi:hypothetical protein
MCHGNAFTGEANEQLGPVLEIFNGKTKREVLLCTRQLMRRRRRLVPLEVPGGVSQPRIRFSLFKRFSRGKSWQ